MNDLNQLLMNRLQMPSEPAKVPPRWQRWNIANQMIEGYQNGWNPNPVLLQLLKGK
jgi:hypothetical protein